jgi:hypothetical protein
MFIENYFKSIRKGHLKSVILHQLSFTKDYAQLKMIHAGM